jgi:hypothetical protein
VSHHSFAGVYDEAKMVTVSGVVTQFKFVNPHAMMTVDVVGASGKLERWTVEFDGRLNLAEGGWAADTIKAKEKVTVTGNPTWTSNSHQIFFRKLVRPDGSELVRHSDQIRNSIDEERRQKAAAREKK